MPNCTVPLQQSCLYLKPRGIQAAGGRGGVSRGVLPGRGRLLLPTVAQQYAVGTNRVDGIMQVMLLPRQQWEVITTSK